ncbi:N-acyl-L-homoserine lactone synthetase [Bradyrhizobium diazoefficiens]|jgi:acyl homoserine lactone synthase|uniref:Autoinducer synthesis protein n=2 Tax=Bradyrhizobium diazoefficiens TaxID=1355477 RepID=A0A0E4BXK8_9BRAD|nr:acyl-homoserine-lactone synthase TraI [Bradyrhizobium diazoefficiens]MBR0867713.1 autoinducer synthesis protein [Bradyrhizobium diazoefficiens]MBR0893007.1 autoinducer synthesis protein [Bradyrhizobium diazoefficiens]MBR0924649.1 autoinducer synthesis protein [Bradyrhizobium diazoefficiens]BAR63577.1 autoinducer synthesis protein [Bradyrhizobium diazoefficiens]
MRAIAIDANEHGGLGSLVDEMHQLRARMFAHRLGCQVRIEYGRERDEYDALNPTYILALTNHGGVAGCARLLPTTGPTMLSRTCPQLLPGGGLRSKSTRIESSRVCLLDTRVGRRGGRFLHEATLTMFAGMIEWSMSNGFGEIATATDVRFERILQRAGWPMTRFGGVKLIGETMSVAGILPAGQASFNRVCPPGYRSDLRHLQRVAA